MTERVLAYEHDGLTFDVLDEGPVDGEVVVLLLHGFPERASCWRGVAPLLHERGYRTLAPDQRGYSPGARPGRRRDHRIPTLARDVAALIERVGPAHVVGHDWGAVVAWAVAIKHPELVRTLTAISVPHPQAFLSSMVTSRQGLKSWYMYFFQLPRVPEFVGSRRDGVLESMLRRSRMTTEDIERFRREIVDYGALPGGLAWYRALTMLDRSLLGARVQVPTTMVWSDDDDFVGRRSVDGTARYVDAPYELVVLEGVSHWVPTQASEACAEAILRRIAG